MGLKATDTPKVKNTWKNGPCWRLFWRCDMTHIECEIDGFDDAVREGAQL